MQHTVNASNKVGKYRQQLLSQCFSTELYFFSSKYLCKQRLQSKPKSEYEKKHAADSDNWRSRFIKHLTQDSILLFRVMQSFQWPQWTLCPQENRTLRQKLFCLYLYPFFQIHEHKWTSFLKELRTACLPLFSNKRGKERVCFNPKNMWDWRDMKSNMNREWLAITFINRALPKPNGSPDIYFHTEKLLPCSYKTSQRIRHISVSENPAWEMLVSCLPYDPLRDPGKEKWKKKRRK